MLRLALLFILVFAVFVPSAVAANEYEGYGGYDNYDSSDFGDGGYIGIEPAVAQMWRDWAANGWFPRCYYTFGLCAGTFEPISLNWNSAWPQVDPLYFEVCYTERQHTFAEGWVPLPMPHSLRFNVNSRPDLNFAAYGTPSAPLTESAPGVFRFTFPSAYTDPPGVPIIPNIGWYTGPTYIVLLRPQPPTIEKQSFPTALPLQPGDIIEYRLTITNPAILQGYPTSLPEGRSNFNDFRVTDTLPLGLAMHSLPHEVVVNGTVLTGTFSGSSGYNVTITHDPISGRDTIIVDLDLPAANQVGAGGELGLVTITFHAIVTADAPECEFLVNRVYLTHLGDPNYAGEPAGRRRPSPPRPSVNDIPIYAIDPNPPFVGGDCDEPPPPPPCRDYINPEFEITKNLRLPTGAVPPNQDFEFEIRLVDLWFFEPIRPLPGFTPITRSIPFSNTMTTPSGTATFDFNHVDWFALRPNPGFYTFQVRELVPTPNPSVETGGITVYDTNVFYVFLQVGWICDGEDDLGIMFSMYFCK